MGRLGRSQDLDLDSDQDVGRGWFVGKVGGTPMSMILFLFFPNGSLL